MEPDPLAARAGDRAACGHACRDNGQIRPGQREEVREDGKYDLFFGGEKSVYSQVGGGDLFWGFKHNWRHYFSFMHDLHSGVVNDYALWAVVALALATLFMQIAL